MSLFSEFPHISSNTGHYVPGYRSLAPQPLAKEKQMLEQAKTEFAAQKAAFEQEKQQFAAQKRSFEKEKRSFTKYESSTRTELATKTDALFASQLQLLIDKEDFEEQKENEKKKVKTSH